MNMIERIIWLSSIVLMAGILTVSTFSEELPQEPRQKVPVQKQDIQQSQSQTPNLTFVLKNDYKLNTSLQKGHISIAKKDGEGLQIGIEIKNTNISSEKYLEEIKKEYDTMPQLQDGPNGFKHYTSKWWDPNPKTAKMANISRIFFKETNGSVIEIIQYDYAGGKYDKEIEDLISSLSI